MQLILSKPIKHLHLLFIKTELMVIRFLISLSILFSGVMAGAQQAPVNDSLPHHPNDSAVQKTETYLIGGVTVTGNKKTKDFIILREMTLKKGDYVFSTELQSKLQRSKELVYNTSLFVDDSVYVAEQKGNVLFINVNVKERWYIFPLPYLTFVDRNFNTWWVQQNRSLERINYGIKFIHENFSGANDKMNVWLINGYSQQITLRYDLPFINKSLTKGINVGFTYAHQHEINYGTSDNNKQLFFRSNDDFIRNITRVDFTYSYRPDQNVRQYFRVSYSDEWIADTVVKLNPNYYPNQSNHIRYIDFGYYYRYFNFDYNAYPTKGYFGEAFIYKRGINDESNLWQIGLRGIYVKPLLKNTFLNIEGSGNVKFLPNNSFYSQAMFGYGYYTLRGMEYYVVDGTAGAIGKFTLQQSLFKYVLHMPIKSKTHDKIPFRFFVKAYSDVGYCNNPYTNARFNNILMRTWGAGMDVVSIYDFVFKFEYSINQFGEHGLFIHARSNF